MMREVLALLHEKRRFLITSHQHPDGDSAGSALALQRILRKLGKEADVINTDHVPFNLQSMPLLENWTVSPDLPAGFPGAYDATFVLECPNMDRTGYTGLDRSPVINLDHHLSNTGYGCVAVVEPDAACLGKVIFDLARGMEVEVDPVMATCLYIALVTDAGQFCYANATPESFRLAADLVALGARPAEVSKILYEGYSACSVKLKGLLLSTLTLEDRGRLAILEFPLRLLTESSASPGDAEGVIDEPRKIGGVHVAVMLREGEGGHVKVSMRSQGQVNVETVARRHGGGGHRNAAGFTLNADLPAARRLVVEELSRIMDA
jgi:bifunctional oligoribonuclease and PAP phosphatase NrnA